MFHLRPHLGPFTLRLPAVYSLRRTKVQVVRRGESLNVQEGINEMVFVCFRAIYDLQVNTGKVVDWIR